MSDILYMHILCLDLKYFIKNKYMEIFLFYVLGN